MKFRRHLGLALVAVAILSVVLLPLCGVHLTKQVGLTRHTYQVLGGVVDVTDVN